MAAWVDRLTLSQRKLVFAVVAVVLVTLGAVAFRATGTPRPAEPPAPAPQAVTPAAPPLSQPGFGLGGMARDEPVVVEGLNADQAPLQLPDEELAEAQTVAERFCREYATRRWDEPANVRLARLTPYLSNELAAAFSRDGGGAALEDDRRAIREVAVAEPEFSYPQTVTPSQVVMTVVVVQTVSSTQGTEERRPSFQVVLEPGEAGWQVATMVA